MGFKADLTSKMESGMEFAHFPNFFGNGWASGMEIGIFEVVSKTFVMKALFPKWSFLRNVVGMGCNGLVFEGSIKNSSFVRYWSNLIFIC